MLQVIDQSPNIEIHRLDHAGIDGHSLGLVALIFGRERVPVFRCRHSDTLALGWDNSQALRFSMSGFSNRVPADVVHAVVAIDELLGGLDRDVNRLKGQVGEERSPVGTLALDKIDGLIG